jgi:catechol 2,3-dioxygenase-like lactoylglutathione lyase family enzyme
MFHHISIGVSDLARSAAFYDAVLGALGHERYMEKPGTVSWKPKDGGGVFWINEREELSVPVDDGRHIAFAAESPIQVDAFYETAIISGAVGDGAPGLRPQYRDTYYGAFVLDPDGHKLEAMHLPPA